MRLLTVLVCLLFAAQAWAGATCSYNSYRWNTIQRKAVEFERIVKPYHEVTREERDPGTGCSLCEEDQRVIDIPPVKPFKLCRVVADRVEPLLRDLLQQGAPIERIEGYRVGRTRGDVDSNGNRTGFSNHSFGIALDINPHLNGLYGNCFSFGEECRLRRGGQWNPARPGALRGDGPVVRGFKSIGFKWGGEILGRQKDFMHFSPSGY
jgi:hypothetical protein